MTFPIYRFSQTAQGPLPDDKRALLKNMRGGVLPSVDNFSFTIVSPIKSATVNASSLKQALPELFHLIPTFPPPPVIVVSTPKGNVQVKIKFIPAENPGPIEKQLRLKGDVIMKIVQ